MGEKKFNTYDILYQLIITSKVLFGSKILNYRNNEINQIMGYIKKLKNQKNILDLGCCTGYITKKLADVFGNDCVFGADITKESLDFAKNKYNNLNFLYITNKFYDNNKRSYDTVLLSHVLEHIKDPKWLLNNIKKILNKGGNLIICVPQEKIRGDAALPENLYNILRFKFENVHKFKYSYDQLSDLLNECGFSVESHRYINLFREDINKKCLFNHSLIVFAQKIDKVCP